MSAPITGLTVGARVWKPAASITLNGVPFVLNLDREGYRISFRVVRHNRLEPNEAEVQVFGLHERTRTLLSANFEKARALLLGKGGTGSIGDMVISAGYDGIVSQLSKVDLIDIEHEDLQPGWVTTIRGQDGVLPFQNAFINESLAPGVDINLVKNLLTTSMQTAFLDADSEAAFSEAFASFSKTKVDGGIVLQGPAREVLTDFLTSLKLSWSYQDGKLVLLRYDGTTKDVAVLLAPSTGLMRKLKVRSFGRATAHTALNPLCHPGRQVHVYDELGKMQGAGVYRIDQVEHAGDTHGGAWISTLELRPSKVV